MITEATIYIVTLIIVIIFTSIFYYIGTKPEREEKKRLPKEQVTVKNNT